MNITFIFGNGFDLQCGLDTRYSDFLKEYTVIREDDSNNIKAFKQYLSKAENQELWSDAEIGMGVHLGAFSDIDVNDFTDRIVNFQSKMIEYLKAQQDRCSWGDKASIRKVFLDFVKNSFDDVLSLKKVGFSLYGENAEHSVEIITFNYTNIVDRILYCISGTNGGTSGCFHVHGRLDSAIIMGVNDESQLEIGYNLRLTDQIKRQLIKPEMSNAINHSWDAPAVDKIRHSHIIAIYGVSFGKTDNIWWKRIRDWLEADDTHKLVVFTKDERDVSNFNLVWQIVGFEEEEGSKILQKLGYTPNDPNFAERLEQVYIVPNTKRLDLKPILLIHEELTRTIAKAAICETETTEKII